jgi:hypothetical protein
MSKTQTQESGEVVESAVDGVAAALQARRHKLPSVSSFRIELHRPQPSDPRADLPALAATTAAYKQRNDRMALGLKIGFGEVERRHGKAEGRNQ